MSWQNVISRSTFVLKARSSDCGFSRRRKASFVRPWCGTSFVCSDVGLGKLSVGLATAHHLLTVPVERIVDDGLRRNQFVVVFELEMPKAFGDRIQPRGLRLVPERVVSVSAVYDLCQENDRRITR